MIVTIQQSQPSMIKETNQNQVNRKRERNKNKLRLMEWRTKILKIFNQQQSKKIVLL